MKKQRSKYNIFEIAFLFTLLFLFFLMSVHTANGQQVEKFKDLSSALQNPDQVEWLSLENQNFTAFPEMILEFENLKFLDLSGNMIQEIPENISKISKLEYLDLSGNTFTEIPRSIKKIRSLNVLRIGHLPNLSLESVIPTIEKIKNLKVLDMKYDNITEIPKDISKLDQIEELDLSGNPIEVIPSEFSRLSKLKVFYLNDDPVLDLRKSAETLAQMSGLQELYLENFKLDFTTDQLESTNVGHLHFHPDYTSEGTYSTLKSVASPQFVATREKATPLEFEPDYQKYMAPTIIIRLNN